jgi:ADP-ribose pyrophosphatase
MKTQKKDTKIISRTVEFKGYRLLETIEFQHQSMKKGGWSGPVRREIYHAGEVIVALLYQPETDSILLNQEFRIGALLAGDADPWLYECCAGKMDDGETPEEAVRREAKEETGCDVTALKRIGQVYPSPGTMNETFHLFCARIGKNEKGGVFGLDEEDEEIQTHLLPADDVIRMLDAGRIRNAGAVICLQWFARHREQLRREWLSK